MKFFILSAILLVTVSAQKAEKKKEADDPIVAFFKSLASQATEFRVSKIVNNPDLTIDKKVEQLGKLAQTGAQKAKFVGAKSQLSGRLNVADQQEQGLSNASKDVLKNLRLTLVNLADAVLAIDSKEFNKFNFIVTPFQAPPTNNKKISAPKKTRTTTPPKN